MIFGAGMGRVRIVCGGYLFYNRVIGRNAFFDVGYFFLRYAFHG